MGQALPSYHFNKCLGRGGYGEVYLARQQRPGGLNRRVAVKVLRAGIVRETQAVKRLRDEGRMLALLDHPAILGVVEMTRIAGRVALVTEYVEGVDISRCCRRGFLLPERVVVGIIGEVAAALDTALTTRSPETGKPLELIHRDIKPENIRLSKHGEVKLLDFGIARSTQILREAETAAGAMPFTPGYAAPEAFNEGLQVAASDIFALGVTLYRMLVGERLYEGLELSGQLSVNSSQARFDRYITKRMSKVTADKRIVGLARAMLSYQPEDRPNARDIARECEELADTLSGMTHVRWARTTRFGEPKGIAGASLTGKTVQADMLGSGLDYSREVGAADLPTESREPSTSNPPPVPPWLDAVKPETAPFAREEPGEFLPLDETLKREVSPQPGARDSLPVPDHGLETLPEVPRVELPEHLRDADTVLLQTHEADDVVSALLFRGVVAASIVLTILLIVFTAIALYLAFG